VIAWRDDGAAPDAGFATRSEAQGAAA